MAWAAVAAGAGSIIGGIMGGPSGAQKRLAASQQAQVDAQTAGLKQHNTQQADLYKQANNLGGADANVAGLSPEQLQAMGLTQGSLGFGQADNSNLAGSIAGSQYGNVSQADIDRFANPATDQLVNATNQDIDLQRQRAIAGNSSVATQAGAYGGTRQSVTDALTNEAALRQTAQADAGIRSSAYTGATNAALQNANQTGGFKVAGNQQLQQLLAQRFGMNQTDIGNLSSQGATQQAIDQAKKGWDANRIGILNGVVSGFNPSGSGPGAFQNNLPDPLASAAQGAQWGSQVGTSIAGLFGGGNAAHQQAVDFGKANPVAAAPQMPSFSMFSDRRLKKDVRPVGVTASGLRVYKFRYLWDTIKTLPRVGYMADEVSKIFPHAVSRDISGYDRVNYAACV
jgi:hypothetical protein